MLSFGSLTGVDELGEVEHHVEVNFRKMNLIPVPEREGLHEVGRRGREDDLVASEDVVSAARAAAADEADVGEAGPQVPQGSPKAKLGVVGSIRCHSFGNRSLQFTQCKRI